MDLLYWYRFAEHPLLIHPASTNKIVVKSIIAGALGSSIEICLIYPFEYCKIQLQLDNTKRKLYDGTISCIERTIEHHGVRGLYHGLSIMLFNGAARAAVRFGTWEYVRSLFIDENQHLSSSARLFSGMSAGVIEAVLVDIPTETIKTKFVQDQRTTTPKYKGLIHATKVIAATEGVSGLYRGAVPTIWSLGVAQSSRFAIIDAMYEWYKGDDPYRQVPNLFVGFSAGVAAFITTFVTQPLDVIKTQLQGHTVKTPMLKKGLKIWRREGLEGYYRGTLPRLGSRVLGLALTYMFYDLVMKILDKVWVNEEIDTKE